MPFVSLPGVKGKIFTPEKKCPENGQKHPCRDCFSCQMCGDDRCQICLESRVPLTCDGCRRSSAGTPKI